MDILEEITTDCVAPDDTSPKINEKLAKLIDMLLSEKQSEQLVEKRNKAYLRPENCKCAKVPKMNPEIWNALPTYARNNDSGLQKAQADVVKSVLPVTKVIEKLYAAKDDLSSFDPNEAIKTGGCGRLCWCCKLSHRQKA